MQFNYLALLMADERDNTFRDSSIDDDIRKDAVNQELSLTDSSLKDLLMDDINGSLFDSISWLLMNSGSLEFSDPPDSSMFMNMRATSDALEHSITSSVARDAAVTASEWIPWSQNFDQLAVPLAQDPLYHESGVGDEFQANDDNDNDDDYDDDENDGSDLDYGTKSSSRKRAQDSQASKGGEPKKKRQRERVEDLEAKVSSLLKENSELRSHLTDISARSIDMERQKSDMLKFMAEMVGQGDSGSPQLSDMVKRYGELFAEYGASRQKEMDFHLNQLKNLLLPTPTTKMCLWTLQQDKSFYHSSKSPLWGILSAEIGFTTEQTLKIQSHRFVQSIYLKK